MTKERILHICNLYEDILRNRPFLVPGYDKLDEAISMIPKIREMASGVEYVRAYGWLCFVQGVLFSFNLRMIQEMRDDNRG